MADHQVETVQARGWEGIENGHLLALAADSGFDAFITVDKGFEFQQNLETLPLTVVVVGARSNRIESLEPLVSTLLEQLEQADPCSLIKIGA